MRKQTFGKVDILKDKFTTHFYFAEETAVFQVVKVCIAHLVVLQIDMLEYLVTWEIMKNQSILWETDTEVESYRKKVGESKIQCIQRVLSTIIYCDISIRIMVLVMLKYMLKIQANEVIINWLV